MWMKKIRIVSVVLFCCMLFGCSVATILYPDREQSVAENRKLAQKPKITRKKILKGKYQKQYEKYMSDQFFLRDDWVSLAVGIQMLSGKRDINGVYIGNSGYLLEKYDESDFEREQIRENVDYLASFLNASVQKYGNGHVSCLMVPSKTNALAHYLPSFSPRSVSEQLASEMRAELEEKLEDGDVLFYCHEALDAHCEEYIYYRTDHHWTTLGAFYAYQAWTAGMGKTAPETGHYDRETVFDDFYGTTYNKVRVNVPKDEVELFHSPAENGIRVEMDGGDVVSDSMYFKKEAAEGFNRYNVFFSKNTFKIVVDTKAGTGKTLLLVKDSFANCFVPFLTEEYDRIIMIDYRYGKRPAGEIMDEYKDITDVLVLFNEEKLMQNTDLAKLAETETKSETMEEFDPSEFLE